LKFQVGGTATFGPVFLDLGWMGQTLSNRQNAPVGISQNGPFVGLGVRF
jgi:hypothetical protein